MDAAFKTTHFFYFPIFWSHKERLKSPLFYPLEKLCMAILKEFLASQSLVLKSNVHIYSLNYLSMYLNYFFHEDFFTIFTL